MNTSAASYDQLGVHQERLRFEAIAEARHVAVLIADAACTPADMVAGFCIFIVGPPKTVANVTVYFVTINNDQTESRKLSALSSQ